jgi:hypothetical protein
MHSLNIVFGAALLFTIATSASAQQPPAMPASPRLVVEEIQSGWVFAPDVRATELGGETGALAGGYVGHMTDRAWVFGAGGYVLTNRGDDFRMAYGGPVFEWVIRADRRIGFGIRTLVGAGTATVPRMLADLVDPRVLASEIDRHRSPRGDLRLHDANAMVAVSDGFFVAEPQVNVMWNLSAGQRLVFGLGYRAVGNAPLLAEQLSGVSGSIAIQIGGR